MKHADKHKRSPHLFEPVPTPSIHWSELTAPLKVKLLVLPSCMTCVATTCYETHPGELPPLLRTHRTKPHRKRARLARVRRSSGELHGAATVSSHVLPPWASEAFEPSIMPPTAENRSWIPIHFTLNLHCPFHRQRQGLDSKIPLHEIQSGPSIACSTVSV
jgi:hypothetical protein